MIRNSFDVSEKTNSQREGRTTKSNAGPKGWPEPRPFPQTGKDRAPTTHRNTFGKRLGQPPFILHRKLKRYYGKHDLHFITFSCYRRLPMLGTKRARNLFVKILDEVRDAYGFVLVGFVVMPEHIHLLIGEPAKGTPSTVLQVLKQRVSREMRKRRRKRVVGQCTFPFAAEGSLPQFWQKRFYDFNVWSQKKKMEKLEYMHMNPVKRGLCPSPSGWVWSSSFWYEGQDDGSMRIDPV